MGAERCHNIFELQAAARRRLPAPMYHVLEGGAEDERTLAENVRAWSDYDFIPTALTDVSTIDMRTSILEDGASPAADPVADRRQRDVPSSCRAERWHAPPPRAGCSTACPAWRPPRSRMSARRRTARSSSRSCCRSKDRGLLDELLGRARSAGMKILCLTIDSTIPANRERDRRTGLTVPPRLTGRSMMSLFTHPNWSIPALFHSSFRMANFETKSRRDLGLAARADHPAVRSDGDLEGCRMAQVAMGRAGDRQGGQRDRGCAAVAVSIGANAAMISNHGGRQLDDTVAPIRWQLPRIRGRDRRRARADRRWRHPARA